VTFCLTLIAVLQMAFLAWREWFHNKERNQLIDRLMCRNLAEYQQYNPNLKKSKPVLVPTQHLGDEELYLEEQMRIKAAADKAEKMGIKLNPNGHRGPVA